LALTRACAGRAEVATPIRVIAVAAFMALRYISRGARLQGLMVLAGVGSSRFWIAVFFPRRMGGR
jgi:hypothetical protein